MKTNITSGETQVKIIKTGENHEALVGQIGIIVKILPNGFNVFCSYFNNTYQNMIYYYKKSEVKIVNNK